MNKRRAMPEKDRKTSGEIKESILLELKNGPKNISEIAENIKSNWLTTEKFLGELKEEKKVIELISASKAKIYQRIFGDTYFNFPISEEQRKKFNTLFSIIFNEYKKHGKIPKKTEAAKCAVHAIDNNEGLKDLPIIWYLYGIIPLMVIETTKQYSEEINLPSRDKIKESIIEFVKENCGKKCSQIQKEQHRKFNEEMYIAMDNLLDVLNEPEFENKTITKLLDELFITCPSDGEFIEVFDLTEKVISVIQKMDLIRVNLKDFRKQIFLTLDALWKVVAVYKLSKSILQINNYIIKKEDLFDFYLRGAVEDRKRSLQESLSELNSVYLSKLLNFDPEEIKLCDDGKEVAKITEEFI